MSNNRPQSNIFIPGLNPTVNQSAQQRPGYFPFPVPYSGQYIYNPNNPPIYPTQNPYFYPQPQQQVEQKPSKQQVQAWQHAEINKILPKKEGSFLGLEIKPNGVTFAGQNVGERPYILLRRHWATNIGWVFRHILYSLVPFVVGLILNLLNVDLDFLGTEDTVLILVLYFSTLLSNLFRDFIDWYYDIYIVTNERIINYLFTPFSSYKVDEAMLQNIESVKEMSTGLIPGLFNYGDLVISTEADKGQFLFAQVPNPARVRDIISDLAKIAKQSYGQSD